MTLVPERSKPGSGCGYFPPGESNGGISVSFFHAVGAGTDPQAVVDSELRVRGVEALLVIDASIMPRIASGPANAPAILIGERDADMIRMSHCSKSGG